MALTSSSMPQVLKVKQSKVVNNCSGTQLLITRFLKEQKKLKNKYNNVKK